MKKKIAGILLLVLLGMVMVSQVAQAQSEKPLQLALFNPVQLVPEDEAITGLRLNAFYTSNTDVTSLDLGLGVNRVTGKYNGIQLGLVNWDEGDCSGLQMGLVNYVTGRTIGLQYGAVNVAGDLSGMQYGVVNWTEGYMHGMQYGAVNVSKGDSVGVSVGVVNYNEGSFKGLMLGVVNATTSLNGLQIGLINYNGNKDPLEYMVLVNWSF